MCLFPDHRHVWNFVPFNSLDKYRATNVFIWTISTVLTWVLVKLLITEGAVSKTAVPNTTISMGAS